MAAQFGHARATSRMHKAEPYAGYNSRQEASRDTQRSPSPSSLSASEREPWPSSQRNSVVTGSNMLAQDPMVTGRARRRRQTGQRRGRSSKIQTAARPKPPRDGH